MADSPLSDADSLSSAGASTEPLPGSDPAPISPVKRTSGPSRRNTTGKGGNESDSSLTEQDSSDNELEKDDDEDEEEGETRGNKVDDDEDEDMEPTPRAKSSQKRRAIDDDEEDEEEEGEVTSQRNEQQGRNSKGQVKIEGNGRTEDELSDVSDDDEEGNRNLLGQPPTKRLRRGGGPSLNGSIISSSTANGHFSRANSPSSALSGSEDDSHQPTTTTKRVEPKIKVEEANSDAGDSDVPISNKAGGARGKARGGAMKSRGAARGGGGTKKATTSTSKGGASTSRSRQRSQSPSAKSDSPLSVVSSSDGAALQKAVDEMEAQSGNSDAGDRGDLDLEALYNVKGKPGKPALDYATGRSARGRGRGKSRYRAPRKSRASLTAPSISRSNSPSLVPLQNRSSSGTPDQHDNLEMPLVNGNSNEAPNLPEPSRLVELDTSEPARLVEQLNDLAEAEARPIETPTTNGTTKEEIDVQEEEVSKEVEEEESQSRPEEEEKDEEEQPVVEMEGEKEPEEVEDQLSTKEKSPLPPPEKRKEKVEEPERVKEKTKEKVQVQEKEKEEKREPVKRAAPASAKKGAKKGGKKGKGKEKAIDQDALVAEDDETANDSDHDEDTSDAAFMRKRSDAMEHLTKIEIQFAKLRDMLYVERMTEVEKDRIAIESGTHPELIHLTQLLELRRNKRLELAKAWLDGLESSYDRQYFSDEHAMWNQWQNKRAELRTEMLDEANSKRRRLDREKRALERPKDDTLANILAPRAHPAVPLHHRRRLGFDGEALVENEIAWALRNPDVRADPSLSALEDADAYTDLERMGLREPVGHRGMYQYDTMYGHTPGHLSSYADPRTAHLAQGYPYPAFDPATMAMQSHSYASVAAAAATPAPFASLPPLPGREQPPSRPSSNPRHANYPGEAGGPSQQQQQHPYNGGSNRIYPYSSYPESMNSESMHGQHASWPAKTTLGAGYGFEEERRRTMSAGGTLGATESLDSIAGSRQNGHDDLMNGSRPVENGGRTTPNGGSNPKPRLTLDDHMSHRSPKAPTSTTKGGSERGASGRNSPASFMAIPTIPPFDRHRHEMAIAAARANSPHPPSAKSSHQPSLYSHSSSANDPQQQQQAQYHAAASNPPPPAQRANFI